MEYPPGLIEKPLRECDLFKATNKAHTGLDDIDFSLNSSSSKKKRHRRDSK